MNTTPIIQSGQFGLRIASRLRALLAVSALAALAVPNSAIAQPGVPNQFAATGLSDPAVPPPRPIPAYSQTVNVGTQFSVNIVMAIGSRPGGVYGVDAQLRYNPTQLQVVSVTTAPSSPWTNPIPGIVTGFNNTLGTLQYAAQGGAVGGNVSVATIVFTAIAAGTSNLYYQDVVPYYTGYGRYGSNGLSIGGSVTVNAPLPTQTLTILGGSGSVGGVAANVEYYNPATQNWQPAYLCGGHPWGFVPGTNSWINYKVGNLSDPGAGPTTNQTVWYLYRVRFTVPADAVDPKMTFSLKADNFAQVAINGVTAGGSTQFINNANVNNVVVGQADQVNVDAAFSQNVHPGENTITLNIGDWGGLNGFNFRIDLSMKSAQPLEIVPTAQPPVVASGSTSGTYGTAFSYNISATNSPTSYGATGLPPGLTRSGAVISGTPTQAGTFTVGLSATNAGGTGQGTLTITIGKKSATVELANLNHTYDGTAKSATATTTPAGLGVTFNSGNSFTNAGTYSVIASINDANYTGSTSDNLVIAKAPSTTTTVGAGPFTYNGSAHAGGSGTVAGAGVLTGAATLTYAGDRVNAGSYSVTAHYAGDANHTASNGSPVVITINKAATKLTLGAVPTVQAVGQPVTLTATAASLTPVIGSPVGTVTFMMGSTLLGTSTLNGSGVAVLTTTAIPLGPQSVTATYSGSANFIGSASSAVSLLIYGYPAGGGTFVIGDGNATVGNAVTFWGSQWEKNNSLSGGSSNASFKGFAVAPTVPVSGGTFTAASGNSAPSPASVPAYLGVIVTSKVTKSGSNITGTIAKLVVVKTNPGYAGNPGSAGTGTVVAVVP